MHQPQSEYASRPGQRQIKPRRCVDPTRSSSSFYRPTVSSETNSHNPPSTATMASYYPACSASFQFSADQMSFPSQPVEFGQLLDGQWNGYLGHHHAASSVHPGPHQHDYDAPHVGSLAGVGGVTSLENWNGDYSGVNAEPHATIMPFQPQLPTNTPDNADFVNVGLDTGFQFLFSRRRALANSSRNSLHREVRKLGFLSTRCSASLSTSWPRHRHRLASSSQSVPFVGYTSAGKHFGGYGAPAVASWPMSAARRPCMRPGAFPIRPRAGYAGGPFEHHPTAAGSAHSTSWLLPHWPPISSTTTSPSPVPIMPAADNPPPSVPVAATAYPDFDTIPYLGFQAAPYLGPVAPPTSDPLAETVGPQYPPSMVGMYGTTVFAQPVAQAGQKRRYVDSEPGEAQDMLRGSKRWKAEEKEVVEEELRAVEAGPLAGAPTTVDNQALKENTFKSVTHDHDDEDSEDEMAPALTASSAGPEAVEKYIGVKLRGKPTWSYEGGKWHCSCSTTKSCGRVYELVRHTITSHGYAKLRCPHCEETLSRNDAVRRHCRTAHPEKPQIPWGTKFERVVSPDAAAA